MVTVVEIPKREIDKNLVEMVESLLHSVKNGSITSIVGVLRKDDYIDYIYSDDTMSTFEVIGALEVLKQAYIVPDFIEES